MTRSAIVKILCEQAGLTVRTSEAALTVLLESIALALAAGEHVCIRNFGSFQVITKNERTVRLPHLGGFRRLPAKRVIYFRGSKRLKKYLNDTNTALHGWPAELKDLYDHLVSSEGLGAVLNDHRKWLSSGGKEGTRADFAHGDLRRSLLEEVDLRQAMLTNACLSEADLTKANLDDANLENSILDNACLCWASLKRANLRGTSLRGADMRWADLQGADLFEADLSNALLGGADFREASLSGAELSGTKMEKPYLNTKPRSLIGLLKKRFKTKTN